MGADVNAKNVFDYTPLMLAAGNCNRDAVQFLIDKRADVNAKNRDGSTSLMFAAENGNRDAVQLLIERWANTNAKNNFGDTPLILAAYNGNKDIAYRLINKWADINAKNKDGDTPLKAAVKNGHKDMGQFLLANGAQTDDVDIWKIINLDDAKKMLDAPDDIIKKLHPTFLEAIINKAKEIYDSHATLVLAQRVQNKFPKAQSFEL